MIDITIDIETIPDQTPGALDQYLANAAENFSAPSTLTKEQAAIDLGMTSKDEIKFTGEDAMLARGVEKTTEGETWKTLLLNFTSAGNRFFVA